MIQNIRSYGNLKMRSIKGKVCYTSIDCLGTGRIVHRKTKPPEKDACKK